MNSSVKAENTNCLLMRRKKSVREIKKVFQLILTMSVLNNLANSFSKYDTDYNTKTTHLTHIKCDLTFSTLRKKTIIQITDSRGHRCMLSLATYLCVCVCLLERERERERHKEKGQTRTVCTSFLSRALVVLHGEKKRKHQCSSLRVLEWRVNGE